MIDRLIAALSQEVEMSAEEIADTIWLALQMPESQSESTATPELNNDLPIAPIKPLEPEISQQLPQNASDAGVGSDNKQFEKPKAGIYPRNQGQNLVGSELSFKVPDAPSLREPLTLARALKPLMRRIPSGTTLVLDEAATTQRIADEGLWLPVLRPTLEPWLDLELVVDEGISMQIWRHTIRELERLLKNYGIFRDVRVWGLIADENERVQIRRGIGAAAKNQTPRSPKELIDPSGRRLVLVVSDCVSSLWRNGKVTATLELWAKQGSLAIVQMLPKWLWKRTALGRASEVRLQGLNPGEFNQKLIAKEVSLWDELEETRGVKVPVFTLEADKVATWAQMLSGKGSIWTSGYLFKLDPPPVSQGRELLNLDYGQLNAEQRVQAFRVTASPMARKLAGLLAAAPVISLPVVRLIQEALLKESQQVHVAEVFLGGLLKPLSEINAETNPNYVRYEFINGVRELLVDSVPSGYVLNVVDEVSKYVAKKAGLSLEDFAAVLRNPQQVRDSEVSRDVGYLATVTAQVLRRLGGEYAKFADLLETKFKLLSDEGIDYTRLSDLLAAEKWKEADEETARVMIQASGHEERDWLDEVDMQRFPSKDLQTIDELWFKYSNGRFGFSVQKQIWLSVGGQPRYYDAEIYNKFGEHVGWYIKDKNEWLKWSEHTFSLDAPQGHLPRYLPSQNKRIRYYLFSRNDLKNKLDNFTLQVNKVSESVTNNEILEKTSSVTHNQQLLDKISNQNNMLKNKHDDNSIRIIGDRGAGKTTFMAALASLSQRNSDIPFQVFPQNIESQRLLSDAENILKQGLPLPQTYVDVLVDLPFCSFKILLKPSLVIQPLSAIRGENIEMNVSLQEYPGELFEDLRNHRQDSRLYDEYLDDCATVSKLLFLIDGNTRNDRGYTESFISLSKEIVQRLDNKKERLSQYRIAVVISKYEEPLLWNHRHKVQELMALKFPNTKNYFQRWSQSWKCKIAYFACSSFGVMGKPPRPNFTFVRTDERGTIGVLDNPAEWKPFGLLAPIYWLHTGRNDPRLQQ
ncbi:GUN4 domain-containing protein [Merismopedia glauca]|uniref:GUN4-like domain-containing protein n=1 Tax=Merismopedia glauca CCAP 1448/3 TaxID=1296344 RepID=A0A2T1C9N9_9CYAN|nr:GUN4 domain-containing protein [Merismopedia glauca]PSB04961.1 hypothetical protein C7B64_01690 [Merismopedia glauca CCAP 1448/3]